MNLAIVIFFTIRAKHVCLRHAFVYDIRFLLVAVTEDFVLGRFNIYFYLVLRRNFSRNVSF